MGVPLNDITIYSHLPIIKDAPDDFEFRNTANYIADFYRSNLNGYKPPKTSRICVHLFATKKVWDKPGYSGSLCYYDNIIDEEKYLSLTKINKYQYILDLLHSTVLQMADAYHWKKEVFKKSYNEIISAKFEFVKLYPEKRSKDRKTIGQIVLTKTEEKSAISAVITNEKVSKKIKLLEKRNWFYWDSIYDLAKACKWIDKSTFGISKNNMNCYYSVYEDKVISNLEIADHVF